MTSSAPQPGRVQRLLRVVAVLLLGGAILTWVTPVNVLGTNLVPFGCGSPASPSGGELGEFVCSARLTQSKLLAVALALAAGAVVAVSELLVPRLRRARAGLAAGLGLASVVALPVLVLSVVALFAPVAGTAADGTLIRCGTALEPARDELSARVCGMLADEQKSLAIGGIGLSLLALAGGAYVGGAVRQGRVDGEADPAVTKDGSAA